MSLVDAFLKGSHTIGHGIGAGQLSGVGWGEDWVSCLRKLL